MEADDWLQLHVKATTQRKRNVVMKSQHARQQRSNCQNFKLKDTDVGWKLFNKFTKERISHSTVPGFFFFQGSGERVGGL